MKVPKNKIESK